jgi:tetraacyldisaccharide 4'-kinase
MPGSNRSSGRPRIENLWRKHLGPAEFIVWMALVPAAMLYGAAVTVRRVFWRVARRRAPLRVVSVGNLTVGGNGKTPFTLYLAQRLARRGLRVGIVSRGFGGKRKERAMLVSDGGDLMLSPEEAGDEPVMMARAFDGPVAVAKRRIDGINLLARATNPPDLVLLDDAFQHLRLARDVDIVLVNRERGFGNGWLLPAGPMRERLGALGRAHAVVLMSAGTDEPSALSASQVRKLSRVPLLHATLRPRALVRVEMGRWVEYPVDLAGRRVLAISGLANPAGFYAMLREADADLVGVLEYADHHAYSSADWHAIVSAARDADLIVTTEKDLVKLERFPFARNSLYALRLEVAMDAADAVRLDEIVLGETASPRLQAEA